MVSINNDIYYDNGNVAIGFEPENDLEYALVVSGSVNAQEYYINTQSLDDYLSSWWSDSDDGYSIYYNDGSEDKNVGIGLSTNIVSGWLLMEVF